MAYVPLNTRIMSHPVNWIVVFGVIFIAGLAFHAITGKNLSEL
jgi:hypothetical protein